MPINEWGGGWLDYGEFDKSGIWHLNKDRIKHELELTLKENELCPVLDRRKVLETLEKLPNTISPKENKNWEYTTSYEEINGEYKEVAVGIKPVIKKINRYVVGGFKPNWKTEELEHNLDNDNVINVDIPTDTESLTGINSSKPEKKSSTFTILLVISIIVILYFMFK